MFEMAFFIDRVTNSMYEGEIIHLRMVRRSYGPNGHVKTIRRAQGSIKLENEASNQGDNLLTDR